MSLSSLYYINDILYYIMLCYVMLCYVIIKSKPALYSTSEEPWKLFLAIASFARLCKGIPPSITRTCDLDFYNTYKIKSISSRSVDESQNCLHFLGPLDVSEVFDKVSITLAFQNFENLGMYSEGLGHIYCFISITWHAQAIF